MEFIDLKSQYKLVKSDILESINDVLNHGQYIMGPEVKELESKLAKYVNQRYCISCSSGTDALLIALMAMDVCPGDAVFTTPFTYVATVEVISLLGATPVFVDIDPKTFNISTDLLEESVLSVIAKKELTPKAIIPVDLFGLPADYRKLNTISLKYNLPIVEDGAQGFGGSIDGKKSCSFGHISTTSFFPAKPLGGYGDGGAIFTNDTKLHNIMKSIRVHGKGIDKYDNIRIGLNGRLDTIQAAVLIQKLSIFDEELHKKEEIANTYSRLLSSHFAVPYIPDLYTSSWAQYSILAKNSEHRDNCMNKLRNEGIPSVIYYQIPLHLQKAYSYLGYKRGDFKISEDISDRIFSLPMHAYLSENEIFKISEILKY